MSKEMSKQTVSDKTIERLRNTVGRIRCGCTVGNATIDALITAMIDERSELLDDMDNLFDEVIRLQDKLWHKYLK